MLAQVSVVDPLANVKRLTLEDDPRTATFIRKMIKRCLDEVLTSHFPHVDAEIIGEAAFIEGLTGAITVRVDSQLQFMFKLDVDRAAREIQGSRILAQKLPKHVLTLFAGDGDAGWFCVPFLASANNLHQIIENSLLRDATIKDVYSDFLRQMFSLWIGTCNTTTLPGHNRFEQRLRNRTREAEKLFSSSIAGKATNFSQLLQLPLRVNGIDYPPMLDLIDLAVRLIRENPAPCSVTAHRDEHAKNILVKTANIGDRPHWYLIDLPNVRTDADWVWSIAKMRFWWLAYYYIDILKRNRLNSGEFEAPHIGFEVEEGRLLIEYNLDEQIPSLCRALDQKVQDLAKQMSEYVGDSGWSKRLAASLFAIFYGGIAYHHDCQPVIPLLLGEGVKALDAFIS